MSRDATIPELALPQELAGWLALGAAVAVPMVIVLLGMRRTTPRRWVWTGTWALIAAVLSAAYAHHFLGDAPRIIDATSYWLEARAMAKGAFAWAVPDPSASFRGRFLLSHPHALEGSHIGVIFPPGYPALLAVGFLLGCPMFIGPILAALLVFSTDALARRATRRDDIARIAVVVSALCAALRYHTADTMSHGLSALALTASLVFGFAAADSQTQRGRFACWIACGFATAGLFATRPASSLAVVVVGLAWLYLSQGSQRLRAMLGLMIGATLPLALFFLHQHAVTGRWLTSTQTAYYALADGPPGCFRYGFGRGIGCMAEHKPYVETVLPDGYGLVAALTTSFRRLRLHVIDIANFEALALLVLLGVLAGWKHTRVRWISLVPGVLVLAYAPFYFDGSYPGGGARMLADALPVEHVLAAVALVAWSDRIRRSTLRVPLASAAIASAMLASFALRVSHQHWALRNRDGGHPFFETSVVKAKLGHAPHGLLFVDTDHGFNLAHDPSVIDPTQGLVIARARYDDHDFMLWERLGKPETWTYVFGPWATPPALPHLVDWKPRPRQDGVWRFEMEGEWPPLAQSNGYAVPTYLDPASCVSAGRALGMVRTGPGSMCVETEIPFPEAGSYEVRPWVVSDGDLRVEASFEDDSGRTVAWPLPEPLAIRTWPDAKDSSSDGRHCLSLGAMRVRSERGRSGRLRLCSKEAWMAADAVELRVVGSGDR